MSFSGRAGWAAPEDLAATGLVTSAVTSAIEDAIAILHNTGMPIEQRRRELRALAQRNLDLAKMAEGVSLPKTWSGVTECQLC